MSDGVENRLGTSHGPARNSFFSLVAQLSGAVFSLVLTLFLVRRLGPSEYGVLALAVSIGTIALLISDLGISISASRFVAEGPHDRERAAGVLRTAFTLKLLASAAATVAVFALAPLFSDAFGIDGLTWPLRLIAVAVAAQNLGALFLEWFIGLGRLSANVIYGLTESAVETSAAIILVLLGAGASGAAAGRAIGYAVAGALVVVIAVRLVGRRSLREAPPFPARRLLRYGSALLLVDGAFVLFDRTDVLVISAFISSSAAGMFEGAARIVTLLQYPGIAIGVGYGPRLAAGRRTEADVESFMGALRWSVILYVLLAVPTLVWARPIVDLFLGPGFGGSVGVLRLLAPSVILSGIGPVLAGAANFLGEARHRVPLAIAALLTNVVIDLSLVTPIGIKAGAIGTGIAFLLYTGGHLRICRRALGVSFAPIILSLLRALGAAVVSGAILALFGTASLSAVDWVLGSALAGCGYVGTLLLLREFRLAELRILAERLLHRR